MTPTPEHQQQAETMARDYLRNVQDDITNEASLNLLFAHIPLPQLLADQSECERLRKELENAQHPRIYSRCPACGNDTLTLNKGNLLCTWHECKNPTVMNWVGTPEWQELFGKGVNEQLDALRAERDELLKLAGRR